MGVSDVDPFIMGLTQAAGALTPVKVAAAAILIAAASNNVVKGIYAFSLADRKTGVQSLIFPRRACCLSVFSSLVLAGVMTEGEIEMILHTPRSRPVPWNLRKQHTSAPLAHPVHRGGVDRLSGRPLRSAIGPFSKSSNISERFPS